MEVKEFKRADRDGNTIRQCEVNGLILPVLPGLINRLEKLPDFKPHPDDVFLFAFPRSGTHWTWEITNMLLSGKAEYVHHSKDRIMLEYVDIDLIPSIAPPRVINTHIPFHFIPKAILDQRNKIIHVIRNPKDVAVSYYNHQYNFNLWEYDGKWPAYLQMFLEGKVDWCFDDRGWFGYEREWEDARRERPELPILFVYYEELQQDPLSTIKRIASFLGVHHEDTFYQDVITKCSFTTLKKAKDEMFSEEETALWRDNIPKTFRNGKKGNWKEWFTVQQSEDFDKIFQKEMKEAMPIIVNSLPQEGNKATLQSYR